MACLSYLHSSVIVNYYAILCFIFAFKIFDYWIYFYSSFLIISIQISQLDLQDTETRNKLQFYCAGWPTAGVKVKDHPLVFFKLGFLMYDPGFYHFLLLVP